MELILWHMNIRQRIRSCLPSLWPQQAEVPGHFRKCNLTTTGGKGVKWLFQKKHIFLLYVWTCDSIYSYIMCVCVSPFSSMFPCLPNWKLCRFFLAPSSHLKASSLETSDLLRGISLESTISAGNHWKILSKTDDLSPNQQYLNIQSGQCAIFDTFFHIFGWKNGSEAPHPDSHHICSLTSEHQLWNHPFFFRSSCLKLSGKIWVCQKNWLMATRTAILM